MTTGPSLRALVPLPPPPPGLHRLRRRLADRDAFRDAVLAAVSETFTVNVMSGQDAPGASASDRVHVTVCPPTPQFQPLPVAAPGASPGGTTSVTVTAPALDTGPALATRTR